jgi:ankyrin repeat protein
MSTPNAARKRLPQQPSEENLKKQAKRRARMDAIQLAEAQHRLACEYGFASWPKLMAYVESQRGRSADWYNDPVDNLPKLANEGDVAKVRAMLESGQFTQHDLDLALGRVVCGMGKYSAADRWVLADLLIDAGADPDGDYGGNYGPIVFGPCEGISYDGIKYLIDRGADVSFAPIDTKYGKACPLSHLLGTYSRGKNEAKHKAIDLLLSKGAVVPPEVTPEVFAIHRGDAKALGEMIDKDRSLLGRRFRDMPYGNIALAGATLLHCAVEFGEIECVDAILSRYRSYHDADLNSRSEVIDDIGGQTPIYHAINTNGDGCFYMLEYLIQRNGRYIDMSVKATWRSYGQPQVTPLTPLEYAEKAEREIDPKWAHYKPRVKDELALLRPLDRRATIRQACEGGEIDTVRQMLDEHPQLLTGELWPPAIHRAKSVEMVRLLLDRGLNPNDCPAPRKPLHLAAYYSLADIIELLCDRGADATFRNPLGETPLDLIDAYDPRQIGDELSRRSREALLKAGATYDIHAAVRAGDVQGARRLLDEDPSRITTPDYEWDPLFTAARAARIDLVRLLLERGADVNAYNKAGNTPLWFACHSNAPADERLVVVKMLLDAGANPRIENERKTTALHQAAWRGPVAMVELLIRHNAKTWLADHEGKLPIDYAKTGPAPDRDAIVHMLDRPVIDDPNFRAAVNAIQAGDLGALKAILADHPNLVTDRAVEPACYPSTDYFGSPKLLWFVANNPTLMKGPIPRNIVEIAGAIIDTGAEMVDLQYTLGLVMTSSPAREQGLQRPLIKLLMQRGATVDANELDSVLGHCELDAVAALLESGMPMSVSVAAAMGNTAELARLLPTAGAAHRHSAFSVAVINRQVEAARLCLDAGADVNAFLVCHVHSTPAHQAAINDDVPMLEMLVSRGARLDVRDTLWSSTPLQWAIHEKKPAAEAFLRSRGAS